jgi:hypothetical protein
MLSEKEHISFGSAKDGPNVERMTIGDTQLSRISVTSAFATMHHGGWRENPGRPHRREYSCVVDEGRKGRVTDCDAVNAVDCQGLARSVSPNWQPLSNAA